MKKKDVLIFLLLLVALAIVFPDVFTLKSAFLSGDHRDQQYPWAQFYQQEIRHGRLPWWTSQIHCGFPLLAEGQIGAFYPLNFLFFYFLPFKWAYNAIILFQYLLGGILFYLYMLRLKVSRWGGFFASLIFLFGSAQGGYFYYNYISQKTVIWLPLILILIDRLTEKREFRDAFWLAVLFAVQIFAGYLQVAIYSIFFCCVYFLIRLTAAPEKGKSLFFFAFAGFLGIFFSLVQLLPTYELAQLSSRAQAIPGLAYVGSMLPVGFLTLFYPSWDGFLSSEWYVGVAGLFFILTVLFSPKSKTERLYLLMTILFLLLALGGYSPLYRALVELTGFQGFRTPIKFLFFVSFSCAVLAGFGFDHFFRSVSRKAIVLFSALGVLFLALPVVIFTLGKKLSGQLIPFFQDFVTARFYGKAGHPHSMEAYREKAAGFYNQVVQIVSFSDPATRISFILLAVFLVWLFMIRKNGVRSAFAKVGVILFLFIDLFFYGFTSIRPNLISYSDWDRQHAKGKILQFLNSDPDLFRVTTAAPPAQMENLPFYPNSNMLYGFQDPGAYSPLVMKAYRAQVSPFIYVNDSLSASDPIPEMEKHVKELGLLNVQYVLSRHIFESQDFRFVLQEDENYLYQNLKIAPRAFLIEAGNIPDSLSDLAKKPWQPVAHLVWKEREMEISTNAMQETLLFVSSMDYPGWEASVDGRPAPIQKAAGLFQSIALPAGPHQIRLQYYPVFYQKVGIAALAVFAICLRILLIPRKKR